MAPKSHLYESIVPVSTTFETRIALLGVCFAQDELSNSEYALDQSLLAMNASDFLNPDRRGPPIWNIKLQIAFFRIGSQASYANLILGYFWISLLTV